MKQLDVDVSAPANIMTLGLDLTHVTYDLDPCDLWSIIQDHWLRYDFWSSDF